MNQKKEIEITQIPSIPFEGYYWYSDATTPALLRNELIDKSLLDENKLPFIIEGNFYNKDQQISLQIRNIDGIYKIFQYDLTGHEPVTYLSNGFLKSEGFEKYQMVEAWAAVPDEIINEEKEYALAGMKTQKPAWSAFAGFTK